MTMVAPPGRAVSSATRRIGLAALVGQLSGVAVSPLLTRLYSPDAFGEMAVLSGLANVVVPVIAFGIGDASFAARSDREIRRLVRLSVMVCIGSLPVLWALVALTGHMALTGALVHRWWVPPVFSVHVGLLALGGVLQAVAAQQLQVSRLAVSHLVQGVTRPALQVAAAAMTHGVGGLLLGEVACRAATVVTLWHKVPSLRSGSQHRWRLVAGTAKRVRHFALARTPSVWLFNVGSALPPTLVASQFGAAAAGQFGLVLLVFSAPIGLVQKAIGDVFAGHYASIRRVDPAAATRLLVRTATTLLGVGLAAAALLRAAAEWALPLAFGETWAVSGRLAVIMAPQLAADLAVGSLGHVLSVTERPAWKLAFDVARLTAITAAFGAGRALHWSLETTLGVMSWGIVGAFGVYAVLVFRADAASRIG
jgi:O-antigen/teichoic acid export membrane protein